MEYARLVGVLEYAIPVLLLRYIEIITRDREKLEIPRIVCVNAGERLGIRVEPSRAPWPWRNAIRRLFFCEKDKPILDNKNDT